MMDALSLLVKPAPEPAAFAKSGKAVKGGDTAEKGSFSRELKGLNTDERGGKGAGRGAVSTETEQAETDADSADAAKANVKIAPAAAGPSSFASLKAELQTAVDATFTRNVPQQPDKTVQAPEMELEVQVPDEGLTERILPEPVEGEAVPASERDAGRKPGAGETQTVDKTDHKVRIKGADFSKAGGDSGFTVDRRTATQIADRIKVDTPKSGAAKADTAPDTDAPDAKDTADTGDAATVDAGPKADAETLTNVLGLLAAGGNVTDRVERKQDAGNGMREPEKIGNTGRMSAETQDAGVDIGTANGEGEALATDGQSDRLFRLTRGEGRGQSVDLKIASTASGQIDVEARSPASGQAETVNVLETRRYLGFNAPSNSSTLTAALAGNDEWVSAMHPSARLANAAQQSSTGQVVNTLKLELNPHALGTVTAVLRLSGDELNVHLTVHTAAAYREMREDSSAMLDALRSQGFSVDQVTVSMASGASSSQDGGDASSRFAQQQQQNMQQAAGEGGRNGDRGAPQNGRQDGSDGQSGVAAGRSDDSEQNLAPARGAGAPRPSHVYI
ncbi:flagellar hook-length control protein FliK [Rhizobiaceae bacterium BDR2-2]|uniref:Flagellar hook-length control protein FliK n=1 Tax=Ectorhizobium quercum TaxID=2965071 RepID=A0AAE3N275_9HYPH|nr:flagellar hook-length control protein FliK [Ectorhizobium quercum]MCX8996120.1 flagellar hook-length control protein FliK [Ectorhizobium quercum]MCX8998841.1 flagellar hook-length control protein FliK [Ectorhizobium quercum]